MQTKLGRSTVISAVAILTVLLVGLIVILVSRRINQQRESPQDKVSQPVASKAEIELESKKQLPQISELSDDQNLSQEFLLESTEEAEEVTLTESSLSDLPLETIAEEELEAEEIEAVAEPELKISPELEEIKQLQRKGLIIY